ncbi:MAG: hypothetical protein N2316_13970 [Spirochaetes bacterium]|nr:hypothetical protein [Spirochaetota bacterium]
MMDFDHMVFALSDSTERYSHSSRVLLERLYALLCAEGIPDDIAEWHEVANRIYAAQDYRHKATFSCVAFDCRENCEAMVVLNGGDSNIALVNIQSGVVDYISKVDMNFAGRSKTLAHIAKLAVHQHHRVALYSDGVADIAKRCGKNADEFILHCFIDGIADAPFQLRMEMEKRCNSAHAEYDDVSLLLLNPHACSECTSGVLFVGGSTPQEEVQYQRDVRTSRKWNRWIAIDEIKANDLVIPECSMRIIH